MKKLNVGIVGYGFMGRAHSNAYRKVNNFFDLEYQPVLKAACARSADNAKVFAEKWGYESVETDWRKLIARLEGIADSESATNFDIIQSAALMARIRGEYAPQRVEVAEVHSVTIRGFPVLPALHNAVDVPALPAGDSP